MAPAATATRARRAPAPVRSAPRRAPLRVVESRRRPPARRRRGILLASFALVVGSLLAVAGAQAYLTQGQVRLARIQQQLTTEQARHRDLELKVAQLDDPSHVVAKAQQQGLTVPAQVTDLPLIAAGMNGTGAGAAGAANPDNTANPGNGTGPSSTRSTGTGTSGTNTSSASKTGNAGTTATTTPGTTSRTSTAGGTR